MKTIAAIVILVLGYVGIGLVAAAADQPATVRAVVKVYGLFEGQKMFGVIAIYNDGTSRTFTSRDDVELVKGIIDSAPASEALVLPVPPCQTTT